VPGLSSVTTPIHCPSCGDAIAIRDTRPGRFRIECPKCGNPFELTIPGGPGGAMVVEARGLAAAPAFDPDATVDQESPPLASPAPAPRPARDDTTLDEVLPRLAPPPDPIAQPPRSLGGYRVGPLLATIRAGASYRATRRATGRGVALAIVRARWATDAGFLARFAREAYAAAQLSHPNLAPVVDLGVDRGLAFAASDALAGAPLSDPARGRAGLDRLARAAAILQAARGLRHAHEQQVFHRDLTLDKIRVDDQGLVRLAEVGLGLAPETPVAPAVAPVAPDGAAPATPPAPAPHSAAAAREDVAALGRALRSLIAGEQGGRGLPPGLAEVARRMAGEGSERPYPDLGAAVRALEAELGVTGPFAPTDAEAAEFEAAAAAFDEPPLARARPLVALGGSASLALFVALLLVLGRPLAALGAVAFAGLAAAGLAAFRGLAGRSPIFERAREWLLGGGTGDRLTALAAAALAVGALAAAGRLVAWAFLAAIAVGLAAAYHFALDRPVDRDRAAAIGRARALLRTLRRRGVDEDDVRRFAARQPGRRWEEFFEALFGHDALRSARDRWGPDAGGKRRPRHAPWRDPVVAALDSLIAGRRRERDLALFAPIEERGLEARGVNLLTARRKGRRIAEASVALAGQYRRSADGSLGLPLMNALLRATERPEEFLASPEIAEAAAPPAWREALLAALRVAFGPRARFLAGAVLLAGSLVWMEQNRIISAEEAKRAVLSATEDREKGVTEAGDIGRKLVASVQGIKDAATETRPLSLPFLSPGLARRLDGFGLGVGGLILVLSAATRGPRLAAFAVPGALIAVLGARLSDPAARTLGVASLAALAVGVGVFALGVAFGRGRD